MKKNNLVEVAGHTVERIDYRGNPVITFRMVDELHDRPEGTARKNFNRNQDRFIQNEDFFNVPFDEWKEFSDVRLTDISKNHRPKIFLTQSGYLLLVKTFTDDRAWRVQRALIKSYFTVKQMSLDEQMWNGLAGDPAGVRDLRLSMKEQRRFHETARAEAERIIKGRGSIDALSHTPLIQVAVKSMVENDPRTKVGRIPPGVQGAPAGAVALVQCLDVLASEYMAAPAAFWREYGLQIEPSYDGAGELDGISFTAFARDLYAALLRLSKHLGTPMPFNGVRALGAKKNYHHAAFHAARWRFKLKAKRIHGTYMHTFSKRLPVPGPCGKEVIP